MSINPSSNNANSQRNPKNIGSENNMIKLEANSALQQANQKIASAASGNPYSNKNYVKKGSVIDDMEKLKQRREERKKKFEEDRKAKNDIQVTDGVVRIDADYENMMKKKKCCVSSLSQEPYMSSDHSKILVCVRKRPIFKKESSSGEIDCVSAKNPKLFVHECKIKIDGITKYIEDHEFYFDNVFGDKNCTEDVYKYSVKPTIDMILNKGIVTCFAYGQTGSGKTYTMKGIQNLAIDSIFNKSQTGQKKFEFYISFFEIYGGRLYDLLNNKNKLSVLEDKNQKVQIFGLEEIQVDSAEEMRNVIELANSIRTTHNTVTNETSSRSHAICNIVLKEAGSEETYSKLTLVDLAGSERAQETQSNDKNRRAEGAEINKSLLALKECIRALDARKHGNSEAHVPFRASKLTLVLRDSFIPKSDNSKIIMIACVSPGFSSANHTINTLRYSDRLKEKTSMMNKINKVQENNYLKSKDDGSPNVIIKTKNLLEELDLEDDMQKLELNPTPIAKKIPAVSNQNGLRNSKDSHFLKNKITKKQTAPDNWEYLKKSQEYTKYGNNEDFISDDFIKFSDISDKLQDDEEGIISTHMNIIKDDAKMLTEEGELISNIKGVGSETFQMEDYTKCIEQIIDKKISLYMDLKRKLETYRHHLKEESNIRQNINPKLFI